jgi:hypothetical protein
LNYWQELYPSTFLLPIFIRNNILPPRANLWVGLFKILFRHSHGNKTILNNTSRYPCWDSHRSPTRYETGRLPLHQTALQHELSYANRSMCTGWIAVSAQTFNIQARLIIDRKSCIILQSFFSRITSPSNDARYQTFQLRAPLSYTYDSRRGRLS